MELEIYRLNELKEHCKRVYELSKEDGTDQYIGDFWVNNIEALDKVIKLFECIEEVIHNIENIDDETVESFAFREIKQIMKGENNDRTTMC